MFIGRRLSPAALSEEVPKRRCDRSGASQGAKWPAPGTARSSDRRPIASSPSSWTGSKAGSLIPQTTRVGTWIFGKARSRTSPAAARVDPGRRDHHLARPVPVEHRRSSRRAATSRRDMPASPPPGICDEIGMAGEGLARRRYRGPSPRSPAPSPGCGTQLIYCEAARWSASSIRLFWKTSGCGALTIASRQARVAAQRRQPGDRAAPVVADQREALEPERLGEREHVLDQPVGPVILDVLRPVRAGEAALVGHDQPELVLQPRRDPAPGAVRFRKAVEQDDRRRVLRPAERDVEGDAGRQGDAGGTRSRIADRQRHFGKRDELVMVVRRKRRIRPARHARLASLIRSRREETKFHQTWRAPSIGAPPHSISRAPPSRAQDRHDARAQAA